MTTTVDTGSRQAFTNLLQRQEQERTDLAAEVLREEAEQATALRNAVNPQAGVDIAEAVADIERQIRRDRKANTLLAKIEQSLPSWASVTFPPLDPDQRDEGQQRMIVYVPARYASDHQEPMAFALIDVSDSVFGAGSRMRRARDAEEQIDLQRGRDAEIERERERAATRR